MKALKLTVIIGSALLSACGSTSDFNLPVNEEFNRDGQEISLTVHTYSSEYDLNKSVPSPSKRA